MKTQVVQSKSECLLKRDGTVEVIKKSGDKSSSEFRKHLWLLYTLLTLSFTLHLFVIVNVHYDLNDLDEVTSAGRHRRDALRHANDQHQKRGAIVDDGSSQSSPPPSEANVEFIHPKLRAEMPDDEDPNNPWVWLTSYSRVPVCV
jgi:hypothetical protein